MRRSRVPVGRRGVAMVALAVLCVAVPSSGAAGARSWRFDDLESYLSGELDGVAVGPRGDATLAHRVADVWGPEPGILWSLAADGDAVYAGLSDPARVIRIGGDRASVAYRGTGDTWVTAVAAGGDADEVVAGLSPTGAVVRIRADGVASEEPLGASYVWALAYDREGALWAATGGPGRVVRRGRDGTWTTVHETGDDPVRSLLALPDGGVVAGTGRGGRVVRLDDRGAFVLFDADEDEIVGLSLDRDGAVLALAARTGTTRGPARPAPETGERGDEAGSAESAEDRPASSGNGTTMTVSQSGGTASVTVSAPAGPAGGTLYRIGRDGDVDVVWESATDPPYALGRGPRGRPWVALGGHGRVVEIDDRGEAGLAFRVASEHVTSFAVAADGAVVVGASGDARVARVDPGTAPAGRFTSAPHDAGWIADWGRVHWDASMGGGEVVVEVRTGNVSDPDTSWSPWSVAALDDGPGSVAVDVPPARYGQLRARWSPGRGGAAPSVRALEWVYLPRNRAPRIVAVDVEPPGVAWGRSNGGSAERARPRVADDPVAREVAEEVGRRPRPAPIRRSYEPGVRTVRWSAIDPDGDPLRFALDLRREGDDAWTALAGDLEDTFYGWDARGVADGMYRVRLVADDGVEHGIATRRTAVAVSEPFRIDGTAPVIAFEPAGDRVVVEVRDPGGRVAALEVATGGDDWQRIAPLDGVADHDHERFEIPRADGEATRRVRATDTSGNVRIERVPDEPR